MHVIACINSTFLLLLYSIPWYVNTTVYLPLQLLADQGVSLRWCSTPFTTAEKTYGAWALHQPHGPAQAPALEGSTQGRPDPMPKENPREPTAHHQPWETPGSHRWLWVIHLTFLVGGSRRQGRYLTRCLSQTKLLPSLMAQRLPEIRLLVWALGDPTQGRINPHQKVGVPQHYARRVFWASWRGVCGTLT